jgi:hypothetical protein
MQKPVIEVTKFIGGILGFYIVYKHYLYIDALKIEHCLFKKVKFVSDNIQEICHSLISYDKRVYSAQNILMKISPQSAQFWYGG